MTDPIRVLIADDHPLYHGERRDARLYRGSFGIQRPSSNDPGASGIFAP